MTDSPLILPHDVEDLIIDVLKRRHPEHLAKAERLRGKRAKTFEPFNTVTRMSDAQAIRLDGDTLPALLLGVIGAPSFVRNESEGVDAVLQLGMQVTVMGQKRGDTLLRRDVLAWTAIECMYQRIPRRGVIRSVELIDFEPLSEVGQERTIGDARMVWEVGVANMLSITGYLPADDSDWPAEGGGPPDDPYTPPEDLPEATLTFTIDREAIVE